jgi:ABC-2 type transport system ATP-binding protein
MKRVSGAAFALAFAAFALSGCGAGTSTSPTPLGGSSGSGGSTGGAGSGGNGGSGSNPTAAPTARATAVPTGTSSTPPGGNSTSAIPPPTSPPQAPGFTNVVPSPPAAGTCRAGDIYSIYVLTPTGDTEAFTVFEPATICGGKTYPLVMWGPGYSSSRETTTASTPLGISPGAIGPLVAANYGVVSIDERGFGQDTGTDRVMDPNYEGLMDLSVMNWAQANLAWLAYGPTLEGDDPHEPIMGAIGGSYGGMYQKMLLNIDKRHRLHAIVPQISPNDLNYALYPNTVVKDAWDIGLYALGETGGNGLSRGNEDPFLLQATLDGLETGQESQPTHDFFGYHSSSYFCDGAPIATDGNPGTTPLFQPTYPPKINALLWNGMRDTLFTFNNAYADYLCWSKNGGDVRLFSYMYGHNFLQVVPDPYMYLYYPPLEDFNQECGSTDVDTATLAFFNQYLKGIAGAANAVPEGPCLSIKEGDAILVPSITTGHAGTHFSVPSTIAVAGAGLDVPVPVTLGPKFTNAGVLGGLPRLEVNISAVASTGQPELFFGIGLLHASQPTGYDLLDNQLTPVRGTGEQDVDMTGIAARYAAGDQLALLVFGAEDQYDASATGNISVLQPGVGPVTVSGDVWVPLLNNPQQAP